MRKVLMLIVLGVMILSSCNIRNEASSVAAIHTPEGIELIRNDERIIIYPSDNLKLKFGLSDDRLFVFDDGNLSVFSNDGEIIKELNSKLLPATPVIQDDLLIYDNKLYCRDSGAVVSYDLDSFDRHDLPFSPDFNWNSGMSIVDDNLYFVKTSENALNYCCGNLNTGEIEEYELTVSAEYSLALFESDTLFLIYSGFHSHLIEVGIQNGEIKEREIPTSFNDKMYYPIYVVDGYVVCTDAYEGFAESNQLPGPTGNIFYIDLDSNEIRSVTAAEGWYLYQFSQRTDGLYMIYGTEEKMETVKLFDNDVERGGV